jgi:ABC-type methionine transport system ATPase subunit
MIRLERLTKNFGTTTVLDQLDFSVDAGEIFAVVGPSGAGKSTLAQCVTLLEPPTSGSVIVNGENLSHLNAAQLRVARRKIGTIFQHDGLFSRRTAAQNVALPLEYLGVTAAESKRRVAELLDRVGLASKAKSYPHELSGGQRQRVGIARALALRPSVLIADEATSGLDPDATASVVSLIKELRDDLELAIIFITHEMDTVRSIADSVARLDHGRIVESGALVTLLRDVDSELGRSLQPRHAHADADGSAATWFVSYRSAQVPADWLTQLGESLDSPVSLLGASIEVLHKSTVGHATISVEISDDERVRRALDSLGLDARRDGVERLVLTS